MPAKELSPIEIYRSLPGTNCKECGETNCMAFAAKLVNREAMLDGCKPLLEPKFLDAYNRLWVLLKPAVKAVEVGVGEKAVTLGGEYVLYRHDFTYFHPTSIAVDVTDEMGDEEYETRVHILNDFEYNYIGMRLSLDMLALRSTSEDAEKFREAAKKAGELTRKPIILCSSIPDVMEAALKEVGDKKPLLYAATVDNWQKMAELALKYKCPIVASAPLSLDELKSLALTLEAYGVKDIVLDPGTHPNLSMLNNLNNFTVLRWDAINENEAGLGYPLIGVPMVTWTVKENDPVINEWNEAMLSSALITRFADLLVIHGVSGWSLLPQIILRSNLYTDPRKPVAVEPGLMTIGTPTDEAPVLLTTNFALTYYTVASDLESAKINCYLLVVDSEGMSVESAVAGRKLTAETVSEALVNYKVGEKVKHRSLIIPGRASRLSGEIQELSNWNVSVGPMDSSGIPKYLEESWKPHPE